MLIVIEGQDATGKDTQARLLAEYLREKGEIVTAYSESGTGSEDPFVSEIAKLTYKTKQDINHRTRVLLFLVNRYEQWRKIAEPAPNRGAVSYTPLTLPTERRSCSAMPAPSSLHNITRH